MGEGTNLLLQGAGFLFRDMYLQPDGSSMKNELRRRLGSYAMVFALRAMALVFMSEMLVVGRPIILEALCVMFMHLFLLETVNVEETGVNNRREWVELYFCKAAAEGGG